MNNISKFSEIISEAFQYAETKPSASAIVDACKLCQKLIRNDEIENSEVSSKKKPERIVICYCNEGSGYRWRYELAEVIAKNFRCRVQIVGKKSILFYGHESDAHVAIEVFHNCLHIGNRLADRVYNQVYLSKSATTSGVKTKFLTRFTTWLSEVLNLNRLELKLSIPKSVNNKFRNATKSA